MSSWGHHIAKAGRWGRSAEEEQSLWITAGRAEKQQLKTRAWQKAGTWKCQVSNATPRSWYLLLRCWAGNPEGRGQAALKMGFQKPWPSCESHRPDWVPRTTHTSNSMSRQLLGLHVTSCSGFSTKVIAQEVYSSICGSRQTGFTHSKPTSQRMVRGSSVSHTALFFKKISLLRKSKRQIKTQKKIKIKIKKQQCLFNVTVRTEIDLCSKNQMNQAVHYSISWPMRVSFFQLKIDAIFSVTQVKAAHE